MRAFWIVWVGQLVSLLGSAMTGFGLQIWAFQLTGRATDLALLGVFFMVPLLVISPFVGVWVDRYDRKLMMLISDLAAGVVTIALFALYATGNLEIWHLYIGQILNGFGQAFQWPAYSAAIAVMIPKEQYVRANSMLEIVGPGSNILAPLMAGGIFGLAGSAGFDGLRLIFLIDIVTFSAAIGTLLFVAIPTPERTEAGREGAGNIFKEAAYGFRYIFTRRSLLLLQGVFLLGNLTYNIAAALNAPLILARSGSNEILFGSMQTVAAVGAVVGGLVIGAWGGFQKRIHGVLLGWTFAALLGTVVFGFGRAGAVWGIGLWVIGGFFGSFFAPLINGSNQAIWQAKVAPDLQGRVFSARRLIAWMTTPITPLIAGPLADFVLEPAMRAGGSLTDTFGWLVGVGPGAGMALIVIVAGAMSSVVGIAGYLFPVVHEAEDRLPDHDQDAIAPEQVDEALEEGIVVP